MNQRALTCAPPWIFVALMSGCGAATSNHDVDEEAGATLTVIEADEAQGKLLASFSKGGSSITYEMRLGPPMLTPPSAEELANDPELPNFEVDARVMDAGGRVFHLRMGGDAFIDPTWTMPRVEGFDAAQRLTDISLMREAVGSFRKLALPAGLEQLRLAAIDIGRGADANVTKPEAKFDAAGFKTQSAITWAPSYVVNWDFVVRKKTVSLAGITFPVNHSSVHLRGWNMYGAAVFHAETCNHGTCATSDAMRDNCVMPGFKADDGTHSRFFYASGCDTPYDWGSGLGGHNCNDDSELQARAAFTDSSHSTTSGNPCSAYGSHYLAPGCTY